uniref:glutathione gamma-glutamylcysteinyltransferase n=1 Tax=Calcidiscus leptoporus TaxID=127549 RepID=A0A7S0J770_9EUKA
MIAAAALFKPPPHWVPVEVLWQAMLAVDPETGQSRGYALLSRSSGGQRTKHNLLQLTFGRKRLETAIAYFGKTANPPASGSASIHEELWRAWRSMPPAAAALVQMRDPSVVAAEEAQPLQGALTALEGTELHERLIEAQDLFAQRDGPPPLRADAFAGLLLVLCCSVVDLKGTLPLSAALLEREDSRLEEPLLEEVNSARAILRTMARHHLQDCGSCGCGRGA